MTELSDAVNPSAGYKIDEQCKELNVIYSEKIFKQFKSSFSSFGAADDGSGGLIFSLSAGKVDVVFKHVLEVSDSQEFPEDPLDLISVYGRIIFRYFDKLVDEWIPVYAIRFGVDGRVYKSDHLESAFEFGHGGSYLSDPSISHIVLSINAAIVEYNSK